MWKPFFTLFFKYWDDCPYPIYLISNVLRYDDPRVKDITIGYDESWSSNLKKALSVLNEKYVIFILEDLLITNHVDTKRIEELLHYMIERKAACLRLYPCPGPDTSCDDNQFVGEIVKGAPYRSSTMVAIWDKDILFNLLKDGETAWEFELIGTDRSNQMDSPFLSVTRDNNLPLEYNSNIPIRYICTAITRGKWMPEVPDFCKKEGIQIDFNQRGFWRRQDRYFYIFNVWIQIKSKIFTMIKQKVLKRAA